MSTITTQLKAVNSTSYADELGLLIGLDRLPSETTTAYVQRLEAAVRLRRDHPYEGLLNAANLALGFTPASYISLNLSNNMLVTCSIAGIQVGTSSLFPLIPLLKFDEDSYWNFRTLSAVVEDLNNLIPGSIPFAELLVNDGPAFQLARQTNSLYSFSEGVSGINHQLNQIAGVQVGSELFNQTVPSYTLSPKGILIFTTEPSVGTTITYNYIVTPYALVGAPVALIGLKDPEFAAVAETSNNTIAYQVSEFVQAAMLKDRSYWAK